MLYLISIAVALLFFTVLAKAVKKRPVPFYIGTALMIAYLFGAYMLNMYDWWPDWFTGYFAMLFARGSLSTAVFALVMYLGVVPGKWKPAARLRAIRGEMSIIGCILALGHNIYYGIYYFPHLFTEIGELEPPYIVATVFTLALIAIMLPLMVTSFRAVRRRMSARVWKRLQRLAYVFYALLYAHIVVVLTANMRGPDTWLSLAAYTAVFVPYFALRIQKHYRDARKPQMMGRALSYGVAVGCVCAVLLLGYRPAPSLARGVFRDGVYTGTGYGYRRNFHLIVTVEGGNIHDVQLGEYNDDKAYVELAQSILPLLLRNQSSEGVDTVAGATRSSKGILSAFKDAIAQATPAGGGPDGGSSN